MRLPRIVPAKRANLRSSLLRPVHIALLLGALLFPAVAEAQNPPPAAVETPVEPPKFTPGEAALLVLAVKEPATQTKLTYALRDADPRVRAVAARIAAVTRSMGQLPALLRALPGETDAVAAREITRALVMLQDEQADATLRPLLVKLGPGAITGYGDIVARKRPGVWLELLPELVKVREAHRELGRITALAVRFRPEGGAAAGAAVAAHGSTALLDALLAEGGDDSGIEAFLTAASGTSDSAMRERVVWFVTRRTLVGQAFPPALLGELAEQRSAERSWEAFGRELLARSGVRRGAPTSWADVLEAHPDEAKRLAPHRESELFTKDERASLARFGVEALPRRPMSGPAPGVPSPDPPRIRTAEWILPGLLGDVLRAAGCRPLPDTSRLVADVTYRPNGTIARASVGADKLSPECQRAAFTGVSLSLSLPRAPHITDDPTPILLSFDPETVACLAEEPDSAPDMPSRLGADVTTPTGIRRVNPVYPAEAQRQRIQGVIILEAALSRRGCVTHAEVLRSIPFLDLPALVAVTQWQYAPIEREGRPVPVILTVAVNFMLKPR